MRIEFNENCHKFCVVKHFITDRLAYIGISQIGTALRMNDAERNSAYRAALTAAGGEVVIEIASMHGTRGEAVAAMAHSRSIDGVPISAQGARTKGRVRDIDSDEMWMSASECARAIGSTPSTVANHLNKRKGYETVQGRRLERDFTPLYAPYKPPVPLSVNSVPAGYPPRTAPIPPASDVDEEAEYQRKLQSGAFD